MNRRSFRLRRLLYYGIISTLFILIPTVASCGKIGAPLPPVPRAPLVIDELTAIQSGTQIIIRFPIVRTQRSQRLDRIDVYRLIESTNDPLGLPQEEFSTRSTIITSLPADRIPLNRSIIEYADPIDLKNSSRDLRYRYAVRIVTTSGVVADFSTYATITPLIGLALPPSSFQTRQTETEIEVTWTQPSVNEDGTAPANVTGYNVYRRKAGTEETYIKLNPQPVKETKFIDRNFQFNADYEYIVHSVSTLQGGSTQDNEVESNRSEVLSFTPKDTFPPSAPTSVTIASIGGIVSIFWPLNPESDVAGYNIYRSEAEDTPPDGWTRLTPQLHRTASFRDERVMAGKQYFYSITAVDVFGNESARSAIVSEVVAP